MKSGYGRRNPPGFRRRYAELEVEKEGARTTGVIYDAFGEEGFSHLLWELIASRRRFHGRKGTLAGRPSRRLHRMRLQGQRALENRGLESRAEQQHALLW